MIKLRKHSTNQASHEDLFLERYDHLDGYLQRMARNLQLSEIRRRAPTQSLTPETVEHETAAAQLQALKDHESRVAAGGELSATCRYAVIRKESSRAGSALILRFFHGYHIHEIAQILRTRKQPVYDLLRVARREARMFRENGERLSFIAQISEDAAIRLPDESSEDGELIEGLRDAIFNSCRTACLPARQLRRLYRRDDEMSIDAALAAHIVSCRRCLEEVNRTLGLRPLQDRFPTDTLGPGASSEEKKDAVPPKRKQSTRDWIAECRERAEEIFRHEPEELLVSNLCQN